MSTNYTKNQILIWGGNGVIITNGEILSNNVIIGHCITISHNHHTLKWFKRKHEIWPLITDYLKPLPKLLPILNFEIYNDELY